MDTLDEKDKRRWQWKSVACISRSIDCSEATMETCQDLISNQDTAFRDSTGSLECKDIADTKFEDWEAFQTYMSTERCRKVINTCINTASAIIGQHKQI